MGSSDSDMYIINGRCHKHRREKNTVTLHTGVVMPWATHPMMNLKLTEDKSSVATDADACFGCVTISQEVGHNRRCVA